MTQVSCPYALNENPDNGFFIGEFDSETRPKFFYDQRLKSYIKIKIHFISMKDFQGEKAPKRQRTSSSSKNQCFGSVVIFPDPDPEVEAGGQYGSGSGSNPDPGL